MRLHASKSDILIIGGGASGLAAACVLTHSGRSLRVLEAQNRIGRKLLATGNGRCNLMNAGEPLFFGRPAFAAEVLRHCPQSEVLRFFDGLGLITHEEEGGLVYPASGQAASVLDVLRLPLETNPDCDIVLNARVSGIRRDSGGFLVTTQGGQSYAAAKLIMAAGSPAHPQLSGSDSAYGLLTALGHRLSAPPRPVLTALITDASAVQGLKGLRLPAVCTLCEGERPVCRSEGELLFAADGISGVCVMQLSRDAGDILLRGGNPLVYLDFTPLLGLSPRRYRRSQPGAPGSREAEVLAFLAERAARLPKDASLLGALPRLLAERLKGLPPGGQARLLSAFPLHIKGLRGFEHAQAAAGGIDTGDVDPATMSSRLVPGLYLTGELLDVDGDCGGHNLLFAWASGILAGRAAGK